MTPLSPDSSAPSAESIDRYLAGDGSPAERASVDAWLAREAEAAEAIQALSQLQPSAPRPAWDAQAGWAEMQRRLGQDHRAVAAPMRDDRRSIRRQSLARAPHARLTRPRLMTAGVTAALFIGIAAGVTYWRSASVRTPVLTRDYATRVAQRATVDLPDGSRVVLAPETRLTYRETRDGRRAVELSGQAYFDVQHGQERLFTVMASGVETRVLGTAFQVRAYSTDSAVDVAVTSGKVSAGRGDRTVVLIPGMAARIDSLVETRVVTDPDTLSAWTRGQLVFRDTPVPVMLRTLGRWCGYEFRLADSSLSTRHVNTTLAVGDPERTLTMLRSLLDVQMSFDGNVITLRARRGAARQADSAPPARSPRALPPLSEIGK